MQQVQNYSFLSIFGCSCQNEKNFLNYLTSVRFYNTPEDMHFTQVKVDEKFVLLEQIDVDVQICNIIIIGKLLTKNLMEIKKKEVTI